LVLIAASIALVRTTNSPDNQTRMAATVSAVTAPASTNIERVVESSTSTQPVVPQQQSAVSTEVTAPETSRPRPTSTSTPKKLADVIKCCGLEYVGTTVAPGRYFATGPACEYELNVSVWINVIPNGQVVVDLRDGDRIRTSCTLRPGSGATGSVRGPGIHANVPDGNYVTDQPCIGVMLDNELRPGPGTLIFDDDTGFYAITGGLVTIFDNCGGIRPA